VFLNDQETATDLLHYEAIAKTVVKLIRDKPASPITIGVHGDWGAGKSSVLRMTEATLKGDEKVLCLWFNGWAFEGFEDAKTVVIETIIEELRRARPKSQKVKDAAKKLLRRVDWLKAAKKAGGLAFTLATGLPTFGQIGDLISAAKSFLGKEAGELTAQDLEGFAETTTGLLKTAEADTIPAHIHAFRKEFVELLEAAEIDQLVVIVDDLDRCLPETSIATLEAIRLFLFVERTAFVIGADETMIEYAVRKHFPDLPPSSGPVSYARNYLEKLIQVPFRIPALGRAETRTYITLLLIEAEVGSEDAGFNKLLTAAREDIIRPWLSQGISPKSLKDALGDETPLFARQALVLSNQITDMLSEGTRGNPRQIKRFLNSMILRQAVGDARGFGKEINVPVLAKLMLAERFKPDFFEAIAREVSEAKDGKSDKIRMFEVAVRDPEDAAEKVPHKAGAARATKAGEPRIPVEIEDWMKIDWARTWAVMSPALTDIDLRPYIFVTRDKRMGLGGSGASTQLSTLTEEVAAGGMRVKAVIDDIRELPTSTAEELFDAVRMRIMEADVFTAKPLGVAGLLELTKAHPALQQRLLEFAREIPISKAGSWLPASMDSAFTNEEVKRDYGDVLKGWVEQVENKSLQTAAKLIATLDKK
jgi:predicted KAP-like P-loop ATPase